MHSYKVRPLASEDLRNLADYIADGSLHASRRFYGAVHDTCGQLAGMSHLGEELSHVKGEYQGMRVWQVRGFPNHLVFYLPFKGGIEVIRILHGAQDWQAIIGE